MTNVHATHTIPSNRILRQRQRERDRDRDRERELRKIKELKQQAANPCHGMVEGLPYAWKPVHHVMEGHPRHTKGVSRVV